MTEFSVKFTATLAGLHLNFRSRDSNRPFAKYYFAYSNFSSNSTITDYESGRTLLSQAKKVITNLKQSTVVTSGR